AEQAGLWALLMPSVDLNARLFLNGALLGVNGRMTEPVAQNWNRPLLFTIPEQLLQPGHNELLVQVRGPSGGAGHLGVLHLGPHAELQRAFDARYLRQIELPRLFTIVLLLLATGVLLTHWLRDTHPRDRWLALGLLLAGLALLRFHWQQVPLQSAHWAILQHWFVCGMLISVGCWMRSVPAPRQLGRARPQKIYWTPALPAWAALAGVVAVTLTAPQQNLTAALNQWLGGACGIIALWGLQHRVRHHRAGFTWIALAMLLCLLVLLADLAVATWNGERISVRAALIAAPLGLACALAISLQRALSLQRSTADNPVLGERHRILNDISEGVGSRLQSAMHMLEHSSSDASELKQVIGDALTDLSLLRDAASEAQRSLFTLLQSVQARLEPTINAAGLQCQWHIDPHTQALQISERRALQILRIVQESVTNTLKHAGASQIKVQVSVCRATGAATLCISDNGRGFNATAPAGRGLHNMRYRAGIAEMLLDVCSDSAGTEVRLQLAGGNRR
ncbi:MAG: sensor histidine kinase, partial [Pseudomonadales bacterium]